jgi:hypothetical protein
MSGSLLDTLLTAFYIPPPIYNLSEIIMKKAFNVAAVIFGANMVIGTGLLLAAGLAGCPEGSIGACINPLAPMSQTTAGIALTALFTAAGAGLFALGYSRLRNKDDVQPVRAPNP